MYGVIYPTYPMYAHIHITYFDVDQHKLGARNHIHLQKKKNILPFTLHISNFM